MQFITGQRYINNAVYEECFNAKDTVPLSRYEPQVNDHVTDGLIQQIEQLDNHAETGRA